MGAECQVPGTASGDRWGVGGGVGWLGVRGGQKWLSVNECFTGEGKQRDIFVRVSG